MTRAASPDTDDAASTDDEGAGRGSPGAAPSGPAALPDFFSGLTFLVCASPRSVLRMSRYVRAYGGLVLEVRTAHTHFICVRCNIYSVSKKS